MLNNMSTRAKLMLLPALFLVIVIVSGFVFNHYNSMVKTRVYAASQTDVFIQQVLKGRIAVYQFLRLPNENNAQNVRDAFSQLDQSVNALKSILTMEKSIKMADEILMLSQEYIEHFDDFSQQRVKEFNDGVKDEGSKVKAIIAKMVKVGLKLEEDLASINKSAIELKEEGESLLTTTLFIIAVVATIVFFLFSVLFSNIIVNTLNHFQTGLLSFFRYLNKEEREAHLIEINSKDEFGAMSTVVNDNIKKIQAGLLKDNEAVSEALSVVEQAIKGHLDVQLTKQ
ncbi:chemotaxis protein, partial [Candidatus Marinarcus aquaticus]